MKKIFKLTVFYLLLTALCIGFLSAGDGQIDIAYLPFTISQLGSYVVTANLTLSTTDTNGITISAGNVTLDLNGHTLSGPGNATGSSGAGIYFSTDCYNITIRNGVIQDWRGSGIDGFEFGARHAHNCRIESLQCYFNGGYGILVSDNCEIKDNICSDNGGSGISSRDLAVVINNVTKQNGSYGISASNSSCVTDNVCRQNASSGINVINMNTVKNNTCTYNTGNGIQVGYGNLVINNNCAYNGYMAGDGAGINVDEYGNHNCIESNLIIENDRGIDCNPAPNNYIAGNRANDNTTDYDIAAGNTYGPIIDATAGGSIATTNHFANIRF